MIDRNSQVVGVNQPDMTLDQWSKVLIAGSALTADDINKGYQAVVSQRVSPAFILACFWVESHFGKIGICAEYNTRSPGNTRTKFLTTIATGTARTDQGMYARYATWEDGFKDLAARLTGKPDYKGLTTVAQILPVFAPVGDNNDPAAYIQSVVNLMNTWIGGEPVAQTPQQFFIKWVGTNGNNYWVGRSGEKAVAIVDHIMQGTEESSDGWFKNKTSKVSAHFGVARDGRIWQWVALENAAWANGIPEDPDLSLDWLADGLKRKVAINNLTVSIEHEGNTGEPFTEVQYQATLWLHRYLIATLGIKADRKHIIGHYQISARSRPNCPGSAFPWARLMADLTNNQGGAVVAFDPNPNKFHVGQGIYDKAAEWGLTLTSNEQWFTPDPGQPGLGKTSRAFAKDAKGVTYSLVADEHPEQALPGQLAPWDVQEFLFIK